jgi:hypothetical protein
MNKSAKENLREAIGLIYEAIDLIEADKNLPHDTAVYNVNHLITAKLTVEEVLNDV